MSMQEISRLSVIQKVLEKRITQGEAGEIIALSTRQIKRICKRVKEEGERGIVHKSRGKASNRKYPEEIKKEVLKLYREKYNDFGPVLTTEKLKERDNITINRETLRQWLLDSGDWERARKSRKHRKWRERKKYFGELVQMDGSRHAWFEDRGAESTLMAYIDDATSNVYGRFYEYEGTKPAVDSLQRYIDMYGIPKRLYSDRHKTYKATRKATTEELLNNIKPMSQFERAADELGIKVTHANSPQAKGRIERLFGTFQDRVIKEMRLEGIKSIEEGNRFLEKYLPVYNKRFSHAPEDETNMHIPFPEDVNPDRIFCIKEKRTLRNDFTISYKNKLYQIEEKTRAKKVMVVESLYGDVKTAYKDKELKCREIEKRPVREKEAFVWTISKKNIPAKDHPWRKFKL